MIHEEEGGYHIISRIAGQQFVLDSACKDKFVELLHLFSKVYFLSLHSYCVMDNHFHILLTMNQMEAEQASSEELIKRIQRVQRYRCKAASPQLSQANIKVLRSKLGDVSRFVQELKQEYTRWHNKRNKRTGYLWGDRFKGVLISHGNAQLACAGYIEFNPVRAGLTDRPENYRWSSSGLMMYEPEKAKELLSPIECVKEDPDTMSSYHDFLRLIIEEELSEAQSQLRTLKEFDFKLRCPSISQGCAIGSDSLINRVRKARDGIQKGVSLLFGVPELGATRVLKKGYGYPC
jgi:REP element-mobilizing transposase RayT